MPIGPKSKKLSCVLGVMCWALCGVAAPAPADCVNAWRPGFQLPGINGTINAMMVFDDGAGGGPALYLAGQFNTAGTLVTGNVVRWTGTEWQTVGGGLGSTAYCFVVFDDDEGGPNPPALYVGHQFGIMRWNGAAWSAVGNTIGLMSSVRSLVVYDDDGPGPHIATLYAGGAGFNTMGWQAAVMKWNGSTWTHAGPTFNVTTANEQLVLALAVYDDGSGSIPSLFAGGTFSSPQGSRLTRFNGTGWASLGSFSAPSPSFMADVRTLAIFDDGFGPLLYVGGNFTTVAGVTVGHIARWNGTTWSAFDASLNAPVSALLPVNDDQGIGLVAGGQFTIATGVNANRVARWSGKAWSAIGVGADLPVSALAMFDDHAGEGEKLFVGGSLTAMGAVGAAAVAKWDGAAWSPLSAGQGVNGPVRAVLSFNDGSGPALYAGGNFTAAGSTNAMRIAKWNGQTWSPLGTGMNNEVLALAVFDDGTGEALYASGYFTTAGGVNANRVAKWNGTSWESLGDGITGGSPPFVAEMTVHDDGTGPALYVCGFFFNAGGVPLRNIARWNGVAWSSVGYESLPHPSSNYDAMEVFDVDGDGPLPPQLYQVGYFENSSPPVISGVGSWNGSAWTVANNPLNNLVYELFAFEDRNGPRLIAGGAFSGGVASWNGSAWSSLGSGTNNDARAFTTFDDGSGSALYAGGFFNTAGGLPASRIARWSGSVWSQVGAGLSGTVTTNPTVSALATFDDGEIEALVAGGVFSYSGQLPTANIAFWGLTPSNSCRGDASLNGVVDIDDLVMVVTTWGQCAGSCAADVAPICGDHMVNIDDLVQVITHWGACP